MLLVCLLSYLLVETSSQPVALPGQFNLVFAQTLFRHGDRTPTGTYTNDPYQEDYWGLLWGELTTRGMEQQFLQGKRLKKRYIEDYGLVNATYRREEIHVRSADTPRCIQSALALFASFYSSSNGTFPAENGGWPKNWTPIPIHSRDGDTDRLLEIGADCPRVDELVKKRSNTKTFLNFVDSKWRLFQAILANSGDSINMDFKALKKFYGTVKIEKLYNLTFPDWITEDFYRELEQTVQDGLDYTNGAEGFGLAQDDELIRIRGGFLLKKWIENLNEAVEGKIEPYRPYSGHDTGVTALLYALGVKQDTLGKKNPNYASVVALELYKRDMDYYIKLLYSDDCYTDLRTITQFIPGCPGTEYCPLGKFIDRSKPFVPKKDKECDD